MAEDGFVHSELKPGVQTKRYVTGFCRGLEEESIRDTVLPFSSTSYC